MLWQQAHLSNSFQFNNKSPLDQKSSQRVDTISSRAWYSAGKIRFCISSWLDLSAPITSLNWSMFLQWVQGAAGHTHKQPPPHNGAPSRTRKPYSLPKNSMQQKKPLCRKC